MDLAAARKKAAARKEQTAPKGALGKLRSKRVNGADTEAKPKGALAALAKKRKQPALAGLAQKRSSKYDFTRNGLRYSNGKIKGFRGDAPWGTVDVSSGDTTLTFNNRHGCWLWDDPERDGYKKEPRSAEIAMGLSERFNHELKAQGIPTAEEKRAQREAEAAAQRKRLAALEAAREKRKAKKAKEATK